MKNVLRQLYFGEIYPDEEIVPRDKDYHSTAENIRKEREYFKRALSSEDNKRLGKLDDLRFQLSLMSDYANFSYSFRLGVQLMSEVYGAEDYTED